MKTLLFITAIVIISSSCLSGQVLEVTELYTSGDYFFPRFEQINSKDGFRGKMVSSMIQDNEGFVWVATKDKGLYKYDGYIFTNYSFLPYDHPHLIPDNNLNFVYQDSRGIIWIGANQSLCFYHRYQDRFYRLDTISDLNDIKSVEALAISEDIAGNLIIAGPKTVLKITGLQVLDPVVSKLKMINSWKQIKAEVIYHRPDKTKENTLTDILVDSSNTMWLMDKSEIGMLQAKEIIESSTGNQLNGSYQFITMATGNNFKGFYYGRDGVIWASGEKKIVSILNRNNELIVEKIDKRYYDQSEIPALSTKPGSKFYWTLNNDYEPFLFDKDKALMYPLAVEQNFSNTIINKGVISYLQTNSGVIFIGTGWGGLYKFDPCQLKATFHPSLQKVRLKQNNNLRFVLEDEIGYLWLIAKDLYKCNRYTGEILDTIDYTAYSPHYFRYMNKALVQNGNIWLAMEGIGLCVVSNSQAKQESILRRIKSKFFNKTVTALYLDQKENIWAAWVDYNTKKFLVTTGLSVLDQNGNVLDEYKVNVWDGAVNKKNNHFINQIVKTNKGEVWMATGFGLVSFNPGTETKPVIFPEFTGALSICSDAIMPQKYLWIGTSGNGLVRFNITNYESSFYSDQDGLISNYINSVLIDDLGDLWLATNKGVTKVILDDNRSIKSTINLNKDNGLITDDFTNYYGDNGSKTRSGELIFTGPEGFHIFNPVDTNKCDIVPELIVSGFQINYEQLDFNNKNYPFDKPVPYIQDITLQHHQNTIGIEMTALEYSSTKSLNYAYKLENYQKEWVNTGNNRQIQFNMLPPGTYKLKARVSNSQGIWGKEKLMMTVRVLRPWWNSIMAWIIYVLITLSVGWLLLRVYLSRQRMMLSIEMNKTEAERLKEIDSLKSKFFANISHEFRTPLTLMLNPLEDMIEQERNTETRSKLAMVKRNSILLKKYIDDILNLSKLKASKLKLHTREMDIVAYTRFISSSFESKFDSKHISVMLDMPDREIKCFLDPDKIQSILTNLFSNAYKFTPERGTVDVSIHDCSGNKHLNCDRKDGCVLLNIRNSGAGIPKEKLRHLFNRYYQNETEGTKGETGTGIGLALVKELAELHQGSIEVESEVGAFTEFKLRFPSGKKHLLDEEIDNKCEYQVEDAFEEIIVTKNTDDFEARENSPEEDKVTILIVEDNQDMRRVIRSGLQKQYHIVEAKDGEEGENTALKICPDLVISDVMMPKKDGFELAKSLKSNEVTNHIPIILLTARSAISDKMAGLYIGADDYLTKPFYSKELKVRVSNLLKQRKRLREKYSKLNILDIAKLPEKSPDQMFVEKVVGIIEAHLADENFSVEKLIEELRMSRTQLHRKLKALTNQSAKELITGIRMQMAVNMLKQKNLAVSEVAFQLGYTNPQNFSRAFKKYHGHSPSEHFELSD